jgi:hypothetical protein
MGMDRDSVVNVIDLATTRSPAASGGTQLLRGTLEALGGDGRLVVSTEVGQRFVCDWLETAERQGLPLSVGDQLLIAVFGSGEAAIALGRVGGYCAPATLEPVAHLELVAGQRVRLGCGKASIELRADGKILISGDDVVVRAKGTKRIRAGTVSIN